MRRVLFVLAALAALGGSGARAQHWSDSLVPEKSFEFGTVARGSQLRHSFKLINTTSQEIHIASWRAKCGCTEIKVGAQTVPPGTQTVIEATLDTTKFVGFKPSGLTLVLDRPEFVEIDLAMSCFIRGDVLLNPGVVDFGAVARGSSPSLTLGLTYAGGDPNWQVTKVHTISPHIKAKLVPLVSSAGGVQYQVVATLNPTAPPGFFKDEITLLTNDQSAPSIPISVAANVQSAVMVYPSILNLNYVKAGGTVTRDILVRSLDTSKPFKVVKADSTKPDLSASKPPEAAGALHRMKVTFTAPSQPGPYHAVLDVATDLKDEPPAQMKVFATIVP